MARVTVWRDRYVPGWDGHNNADVAAWPIVDLEEALRARYDTDAHFQPVHVLEHGLALGDIPRLTSAALPVLAAAGVEVVADVVAIDLDDPEAHRTGNPSSTTWWEPVLEALGALPVNLSSLGWYRTRGGARLLWTLDRPRGLPEVARIRAGLVTALRAVGLRPDEGALDPLRCFRLPFVRREGHGPQVGPLELRDLEPLAPDVVSRLLEGTKATDSLWTGIEDAGKPYTPPTTIPAGTINNELTRLAGKLVNTGLGEAEILHALVAVHRERCPDVDTDDPKVQKELRGICKSARRWIAKRDAAKPVEESSEPVGEPSVDVPDIQIRAGELPYLVSTAEGLIREDVYVRGCRLVQVVPTLAGVEIQELGRHALQHLLACRTRWLQSTGDGWVAVRPPLYVVDCLRDLGTWETLRQLAGISDVPSLHADGSVQSEPGWDAETRWLWIPSVAIDVPAHPTRAQASAALAALLEPFIDFPCASDADRAVLVAAAITILVRSSCDRVPVVLVDGHTPGTGKSFAVQACAVLGTGVEAPAQGETQGEELEKRITAEVLSGARVVLVDNVSRPLGGAALDAAITSATWRGRMLGASKMISVPNTVTWFVTGNNLTVRGDLVRRALRCFLDTSLEQPELRRDFSRPDLLGWISRERGRLVSAALTLVSWGLQARLPVQSLGSFEQWSRLVRAPLLALGFADPAATQAELRALADTRVSALAEPASAWIVVHEKEALTARAAVERLRARMEPGPDDRRLMESIEEFTEYAIGDRKCPVTLGYRLRATRGRVVGGLRFVEASRGKGGRAWRVERA